DTRVFGAILNKVDAIHVAVGVVEDDLGDARRAKEVWQHRLVALGIIRAEDIVAPGIAEAEMPADLRLHAVAAHLDGLPDPLVVVLVVREEREPRAKILELQV